MCVECFPTMNMVLARDRHLFTLPGLQLCNTLTLVSETTVFHYLMDLVPVCVREDWRAL